MNAAATLPLATLDVTSDPPPAYTAHPSQGTSNVAPAARPNEQLAEDGQPETTASTIRQPQPREERDSNPEPDAGPLSSEQEAFMLQLLSDQRSTLNEGWRRRMVELEHQSRVSLKTQYDRHVAELSLQTQPTNKRQAPLFMSMPCATLKYPGPNKPSDEYKNYLTLLQGELGLNPAMENLLNGVIPHPIAGRHEVCEKLKVFFVHELHKPEWVFDSKTTGHTISVVRRSNDTYANELLAAMNSTDGRRLGESYMQLNKCLYMAVHRTCDPVKRDKSLLSSAEHGKHEHIWNGMGLFDTIKTLSKGENGSDLSLRRTELIDELRQITYVPGILGISDMFERIAAARNELEGMDPSTNFDDATILSYVHRELESKHELFTEAKEIIENNFDANKIPTTTKSAQRVHERFEKRLIRLLRTDSNAVKNFPNLDLTNIKVKNVKVKVKRVELRQPKRDRSNNRDLKRVDNNNDDDNPQTKRGRGDKSCVFHPKSKRGLHDTAECKNPYSKNSLWADQGNQFLTNREWKERQDKGHGPPKRTHGRCPATGAGPDDTTTNPPLVGGQHDSYQPQLTPPHLAVHAARYQPPLHTGSNYYLPAQQPPQQQWVLQDVAPPRHQQQPPATPQQRAQQFRAQHYSRPPIEGPMPAYQVRTPSQVGWDPRTTPVNNINARVPVSVQPVDGMRAVLHNARQHGGQPRYPTQAQTQNFGRGGSFSRRI